MKGFTCNIGGLLMNDGCVKWFKGSMFLRADAGYRRLAELTRTLLNTRITFTIRQTLYKL